MGKALHFVDGKRMFCNVDVPKLGVLGTRFVFREVIVTSSGKSNLFLRLLSPQLHTSWTNVLIMAISIVRNGNGNGTVRSSGG